MTLVVCVRPKGFVFVAFPEPAHTSISMFQKLHMSRNCISSIMLTIVLSADTTVIHVRMMW